MDGIQLSFFDAEISAEEMKLRAILKRGSGYAGGQLRIYAAEQLLDAERFVDYLADEFYVGGHSVENGFVDYNGRGMIVREWKTNTEKKYTWRQIAKIYAEMIRCGEFPDQKVRSMYQEARRMNKGVPRPRMHYFGDD